MLKTPDAPNPPFVEVDGELALGTPEALFENDVRWKHYDVAADGERFVIADIKTPPSAPTELRLVLNWGESLTKR